MFSFPVARVLLLGSVSVGVIFGSYLYDQHLQEKTDQYIVSLNTMYNKNEENVSTAVYKVKREMIDMKLSMQRQQFGLYLLGATDIVLGIVIFL